MAQDNNAAGMQPPRDIPWPAALNDHYCPSEAVCRHGVIDVRGVDNSKEDMETSLERNNSSAHGSDRRSPGSNTAFTDSDYGGSGSLYEEGDTSATDHWDQSSLSTYSSGSREISIAYLKNLANHNPIAAVPESVNADKEQVKVMRAFIKSLTQENINNRRRLEFLEDFTLDQFTDLEAREMALTEHCGVLNEQLLLLARQHNDLLDIMQQFSTTFFDHARELDDLAKWRQSEQLVQTTRKEAEHPMTLDQEAPRSTRDTNTRRDSISPLSISDATVERKRIRLRINMPKPGPDLDHFAFSDHQAPQSTHSMDTKRHSASSLSISDATAERKPVRLRINMPKPGPPAVKTGLHTPPTTDDEIDAASLQLIKTLQAEKPYDTRQNRRMSVKALEAAASSGNQGERKRKARSFDEELAAKRLRVEPIDW